MLPKDPKDIKIEHLEHELKTAYHLLDRSYPYISFHYERSASTFGYTAARLMKEIKNFQDSIAELAHPWKK